MSLGLFQIIHILIIIIIIIIAIISSDLRCFTGNYSLGQMACYVSGFKYQIITISLIRMIFPV